MEKFGLDADTEIRRFKENDFAILTKDNDFEAMSRLIYLTCGNRTTGEIITILEKSVRVIRSFTEEAENCLLYLQ